MIRFALFMFALLAPNAALSQATPLDDVPVAWGETDVRNTTVCAKRWHAIKLRDVRTLSIDKGLGAEAQIEAESKAIFSGAADCITRRVTYRPVKHADVILGGKTWVREIVREGPVSCFDGKRCRWKLQDQNFVEAEVTIEGVGPAGVAYVSTPRQVQPARSGGPAPIDPDASGADALH